MVKIGKWETERYGACTCSTVAEHGYTENNQTPQKKKDGQRKKERKRLFFIFFGLQKIKT